ncbi:gem-associated protein 2 isoform X2 [Macrosteles quadrilineatus]|nr:gem-associated protein 2 isoform X2 [Macrosteles quadrilineatus]XP_054275624.1 gem-associated protein 2 isoform X2 [Macrosteles quadrilineatus]
MFEDPSDLSSASNGAISEEEESFQRPALFVPSIDEDEDLSQPPMDGFEFLKRVVAERKTIDDVVIKPVDAEKIKTQTKFADNILHFSEVENKFCLDEKTQRKIISDFSKLRKKCEAIRNRMSHTHLDKLRRSLPKISKEDDWLVLLSNHPINLAKAIDSTSSNVELCIAIAWAKISSVMIHIRDFISDGKLDIPLACRWIHILLACASQPLNPDLHSVLREITRILISLRSKLEREDFEDLPPIFLIICVIGRYFGQQDLADPID